MQRDMVDVADARPFTVRSEVGLQAMADFRAQLVVERPLMIVGGAGLVEACADIEAFAEANAVPVAASFRLRVRQYARELCGRAGHKRRP